MKKPRNYKREYVSTQGTAKGKLDRAGRNKARKMLKPPKGMEVHHKNGNPRDNSAKNLSVTTKRANRSFPRNSRAGKR